MSATAVGGGGTENGQWSFQFFRATKDGIRWNWTAIGEFKAPGEADAFEQSIQPANPPMDYLVRVYSPRQSKPVEEYRFSR